MFFINFNCIHCVALLQSDDVNRVMDDRSGRVPLHYAADFGQKDVMEYLVSKGADVNVRATTAGPITCSAAWVALTRNRSHSSTNGMNVGVAVQRQICCKCSLSVSCSRDLAAFLLYSGHFTSTLASLHVYNVQFHPTSCI